ncbi:MAG: RsmE family RNA methyltransferase [Acidobacteriaceae bacterium]
MTRRRWIADRHTSGRAWLTGTNATHLALVLRAQPGQQFEVATPDGVFLGTITAVRVPSAIYGDQEGVISDAEIEFSLAESDLIAARDCAQTTLLLAVFKFDRFEWALEKAIELGATDIVPVIARRTEKHLAAAAAKRVERWRRLALEAAQQSRQPQTPTIHGPAPLHQALAASSTGGLPASGLQILLAETPGHPSLWSVLATAALHQPLCLAIGPIGGWADDEFQLFSKNGWAFASLGDFVLRVETATIAALAIVNQARLVQPRPSQ